MSISITAPFSSQALESIESALKDCIADLALPVVISIRPDTLINVGEYSEELIAAITAAMQAVWKDHEEMGLSEAVKYINVRSEDQTYHLYTLHLSPGIILGAGWSSAVSLTQLRAECDDLALKIARWY